MNRFDAGAMRTPTGWIGFYRAVHRSENFVLRDGPHDIIFATEGEAKEAALGALLDYLNSPIISEALTGPTTKKAAAKATAEAVFSRRVDIEQKEEVA